MEIFRAYDIRGVYPRDINDEIVYKIGQCLVKLFKAKNCVIGRDVDLNSPNIHKFLVKGIIDAGADVVDIGLASTDMLYFATGFHKFDFGVEITASHSAAYLDGIKIIGPTAKPFGGGMGMEDLKNLYEKYQEKSGKQKGKIKQADFWQDYIQAGLKFVDIKKIKPLKIVVDASNSVGGLIIDHIEKLLPVEFIKINWELDGNYPGHEPNPFLEENRKQLAEKVKQTRADMGIIFDCDGDRIYFIDENSDYIYGVYINGLIVKKMLKKNPGRVVLYDIRATKYIKTMIEQAGGIPKIELIGHPYFKQAMKKEQAIFGAESSGHIYYNFNEFMIEHSLIALLQIMQIVSETGKSLGELTKKPRKQYPVSGEYNFSLPGFEITDGLAPESLKAMNKILEKIKQKYHDADISDFDTLTMRFSDWNFNLRPSANDAVIRLNLEAKTPEIVEQKIKEIINLLDSLGSKLINHSGVTQVQD